MRRKIAAVLAAVLVAGGLTVSVAGAASATTGTEGECTPSPAYTEVTPDITHPAVGEPTITKPNPDYVAGVSAVWANFSPNDEKATFVGPALYPVDERGTWNVKDKVPGGHEGENGVYAKGNPDKGGNWFYRQAEVLAVGEPTITVPNPDYMEAWTEVVPDIEHPAVVCEDEPVTVEQCEATDSVHTTDLATWNLTQTRSAGHNELIEDGLHVWTDDASSQAKAAGYFPASFPLYQVGSFDLDWDGTSPAPGGQLLVDLDDNGSPEGYLVVEDAYGVNSGWLSSNWTGIDLSGAPTSFNGGGTGKGGTFNEWLAEFPEASVSAIGYSLGSGVKGDGVINSITAGCTTYTFDYVAPVPTICSAAGDWYTEGDDVAPVQNVDGLAFTTTGSQAVGYRLPVTGNLQGWNPLSFTATGDTSEFFFRIVIDASADGGKAYQSLSFPGTNTITSDSVSYQLGESIAATAEKYPHAVIKSIGFQTNSKAEAGKTAVLTSLTSDCGNVNFVPEKLGNTPWKQRLVNGPVIDCEAGTHTTTWEIYRTEYVWDDEAHAYVGTEVIADRWDYTRDATESECPTEVVPPTEEPKPTEKPQPSETPTPAAPAKSNNGSDSDTLASTGTDATPYVVGGVILLIAGAALTLLFRRRKASE